MKKRYLICFFIPFVFFTPSILAQEEAKEGEAAVENTEPEFITPPPIYMMAKSGNLERMRSLIADGLDVDAANQSGRTALMAAVFYRNRRIAEELVMEGADVDAVDKHGRTALMMAIQRGYRNMASLLIEAGADVSVADKKEKTALLLVENSKDKELKKLIEEAAESDSKKK